MSLEADAVVIGAGPAGTSSALFLARRGFQVLLLDKARFPRPKACGEGVMPGGLPVLAELGILGRVEAEGRRFYGVRFIAQNEVAAEGRFPGERYGLILPRERLDEILLEEAKAASGIAVSEGSKVVGVGEWDGRGRVVQADQAGSIREIRARWLLAADGTPSATAKLLGVPRRLPRRARFGLRARFDGVEGLGELVEVFLMPGFEIYLAPHPGGTGRALIALLLDQDRLASFEGRTQEAFLEALASCGELKERIGRAVLKTSIMGCGPLGGAAARCQGDGWLLVGDAASSLDPITGEGIATALRNGRQAAASIGARTYGLRRGGLLLKKKLLESFMLSVASRPALADAALKTLARHPNLFTALLSDC